MSEITLSFSREMAEEFGITVALVYQELKRKQFYWSKEGRTEDGWFYCDQQVIADWVLCNKRTVFNATERLIEAGLLEKKVSYKPGSSVKTTWWKCKNALSIEVERNSTSEVERNSTSILNHGSDSRKQIEEEEDVVPEASVLFPRLVSKFKKEGFQIVNKKRMKEKTEELVRMLRSDGSSLSLNEILDAVDYYISSSFDSKSLGHFLSPNVFSCCVVKKGDKELDAERRNPFDDQ